MNHTSPLNILFICTGNICRSPLAAQLLAAGLASAGVAGGAVRVSSRGTQARGGVEMDALSARQSLALGGDPAGHLSERLTPADLRGADLVVAMTLEQRATAARMLPAASKKSVTLLELARLIEHNPVDATVPPASAAATAADRLPAQQVERLLSRRSAMPLPKREADLDIGDPYRRSAGIHAKVAAQVDVAVSTLSGWLAAVVPAPAAAAPVVVEPAAGPAPRSLAEAVGPPAPPLTRREARALREIDIALS